MSEMNEADEFGPGGMYADGPNTMDGADLMQPDEHAHKEYLAQTRLDEVLYELIELGWTDEDITSKVEWKLQEYAEGGEEE